MKIYASGAEGAGSKNSPSREFMLLLFTAPANSYPGRDGTALRASHE
jgi:hypothetical protein